MVRVHYCPQMKNKNWKNLSIFVISVVFVFGKFANMRRFGLFLIEKLGKKISDRYY